MVLGAAVGLLNAVGPAAIEGHVLELGDYLIDGLDRLAEVTTEPENVARALGEALSGAVPARETPAFHRDLQVRLMWHRRGSRASKTMASREAPLDQLIRILSAPLGAPAEVERKN